jgi:hypothetical protein
MATVWNVADKTPWIALTHGNHIGTSFGSAGNEGVRATTSHGASGKYYLEYTGITPTSTSGHACNWGFADASMTLGNNGTVNVDTAGYITGGAGSMGGDATGHTVCFAMDFDNKRMWARYDGGSWVGNGVGTPDPVANTGGIDISSVTVPLFPYMKLQFTADTGTLNCGDSSFLQTVPTGFTAWDASAAGPTPPDVVYTSGANITGTTSATVAYTTVGTDNIVILHSQSSPNSTSGSVDITTVTDTNGLTWHKKTSLHFLSASSPNTDNTQEVWWAHAPTAVSGYISVTFGATIDDGAFTTLSISGVYDVANPFDPNVSMPATATNTTGAAAIPSTTISTTAAATLVLGFYGAPINHAETAGSLTVIVSQTNAGGTNWGYNYVGEAAYTAAQTSITASLGSSVARWGFIVLALSGSSAVTYPTGTMTVTDAPDVFAAVGTSGLPGIWGSLAAYEAADVFTAVGYIPTSGTMVVSERPDIFSAYGTMPVTGHMTITEHPDVFAALGYAAGGVNGIWATTEARDHFAAIGSTPIVGVLNVTEAPDRFQAFSAGVTQVRRRRAFFVT